MALPPVVILTPKSNISAESCAIFGHVGQDQAPRFEQHQQFGHEVAFGHASVRAEAVLEEVRNGLADAGPVYHEVPVVVELGTLREA